MCACRRMHCRLKRCSHTVDISHFQYQAHRHPETCCFTALVTPTHMMMIWYALMCEYMRIFQQPCMCERDRPPGTPWPSLSLCDFQENFPRVFPSLHHIEVWLTLLHSGDLDINHLCSLVWLHTQCVRQPKQCVTQTADKCYRQRE